MGTAERICAPWFVAVWSRPIARTERQGLPASAPMGTRDDGCSRIAQFRELAFPPNCRGSPWVGLSIHSGVLTSIAIGQSGPN